MQLTIKVKGEIVRQGLQDLSAEIPKIGRRGIRDMMNRVVRKMQAYPPENKNTVVKYGWNSILGRTYMTNKRSRTGTYFRSWKIEEVTNGYKVENTAARNGHAYAVYVGGDAYGNRQRLYHAETGWLLTRDVVEDEVSKLPKEIEDEITMVARRVL
jgi:hypothetical protein